MGRIRTEIKIGSKKVWTLFDTGSRNSYIVSRTAKGLPMVTLPTTFRVSLGGKTHGLRRSAQIVARIQGKVLSFDAFVLDSIGRDEEGREIEVLFGALAMQRWGVRPVPDDERLDLSHYSKEFIEF